MRHDERVGTVRPPQQRRSRESWQRALDIGTELFVQGGYEALSVSEVCRRAGIAAPSLYARVDGLEGLFRAIYERGMAEVAATEDRVLTGLDGSVEQLVSACAEIFSEHAELLRAVIRRATADPELLAEGAALSRRLRDRMASLLPGAPEASQLAARTIYTECAFRVIYGAEFWDPLGESANEFETRVTAIARRVLANPEYGIEGGGSR